MCLRASSSRRLLEHCFVFFPFIYFQVMKSSHRWKTGSADSLICSHLYMSFFCVCVCVCVGLSVETIHRLILHFFLQMYSSTIISCRENRAEPCYYKQKCMVLLLLASSVLFFPAKQRTRFSSTDEVRGGNIRR